MPVAPGDPGEIAAVLRVPVADLASPANRMMIRYPNGQASFAFRVSGLTIWGFTAMLLDRVLALGGFEQPWDLTSLSYRQTSSRPAGRPSAADIGASHRARPAWPRYKLMLCPATCST